MQAASNNIHLLTYTPKARSPEGLSPLPRVPQVGCPRLAGLDSIGASGEESASKLMQNDGKVNFLAVISLRDPTSHPLVKICSPVLEATHSDPKDDHLH